MVQTERNQEKVVVTKICFYVSAKIEWKISVCDGRQGFCCQDDQNEVLQPYANVKTACFVKHLRSIFLQDFYNRDSFDEMIKMRGNSPMLTSKQHILSNILAPCWQISWNFYNRDSFDEMIEMRVTTLC